MTNIAVFDGTQCLGIFHSDEEAQQHVQYLVSFCKRHGGKVSFANIRFETYNYHLLKEVKSYNTEESDINLFIPLETVPNNPNIDALKEKLDKLATMRDEEERELQRILQEKNQEYIEEKARLEKIKLEMKKNQEKWEEIQKKFDADKKLYYIFKREIENGERIEDEIPILFKDNYPVFKQLDEEEKLNTNEEVKHYLDLTKYYKNTIFLTSEFDNLFDND
jgi:hypothetical protein